MALSGTINGAVTLHDTEYNYYITWTATQSVAGNYSDITTKTYWSRESGYFNEFDTVGTRNASVTIGDNTYSWSQRFDLIPFSPNPYLIKEYTARVYHASDGTKSVTLSSRTNGYASTYGPSNSSLSSGDCTASATVTLDTIPRASAISLSTSSITAGNNLTVTITPASASFTHTVTYYLEGSAYSYDLAAGVTEHVFTVPTGWCDWFPNANSGTATCSVQTKSGGVNIGSAAVDTFTVNVPSYSPDVTLVITPNEQLSGDYVQNKSTVSGTITASSFYGATIASYSTSASSKTYTGATFTTTPITATGTVTITTTVTDSRGKTNTDSENITVYAYASPYITTLTAERCTSDGTPSESGTYALVTFVGGCSAVNNKNTYEYIVHGDTITNEAYTINKNDIVVGGGLFDADSTYTITASIEDAYSTVTKSVTLPTEAVTMDFLDDGKGVAFGKVAETTELLDCAWAAKFPSIIIESWAGIILPFGGGTAPDGTFICDGSAKSRTTYSRLFAKIGTTWGAGDGSTTFNLPNLKGRNLIGAGLATSGTTFTLGATGGAETHTLTVDEIPAHGHEVNTSDNSYPIGYGGVSSGGEAGIMRNSSTDKATATNTGGGQAHNNMPPYAVINYVIVY